MTNSSASSGQATSTLPPAPEPALNALQERELRADPFHAGIRFVSLGMWFAAIGLVFLVGRLALAGLFGQAAAGWTLLLAVAAVFLAQPLAYWGEKRLVSLWPSGRSLRLEAGSLTLREKSGAVRVDLARGLRFWRWRFAVRGRQGGRVPNGHLCCAVRLVQDDASFSAYAFLPPKRAEALAARYAFYELRRSGGPGKRLPSGRDAAYLAAERARWESGAELDPADLDALLAYLAAHVPDFASATAS